MSNLEAIEEHQSAEISSFDKEKNVATPKSITEINTFPESECGSEKSFWLVGHIVWSRIPGHPWWPSMIAYEPNTAVYFKYKGRIKYYHVQFFGAEALRGWATERNILKYEGKSHFLSLRLSVHGKQHKIGNKQLPMWETAIKMADKALPLNRHERQLCFTFKYTVSEKPTDSVTVTGSLEDKKPKCSFEKVCNGGLFEPPVKSAKLDETVKEILCVKESKSDNAKLESCIPKNQSKNKQSDKFTKQQRITAGKHAGEKLDIQVNNKLNEQVNNKMDKLVNNKRHTIVKNKQIKTKCTTSIVNNSQISCTLQMNNAKTPESGKRKRGRPRKVLVDENKESDDQPIATPKKLKIEQNQQEVLMKTLPSHLSCPVNESDKSDVASDTNSTSSMDIESRSNKSALKPKEFVCTVCEQPDNLLICEGICNSAYHQDCLGLSCDVLPEKFICDECTSGNHTCFICRKTNNVIKCSFQTCGKFYHLDCVKNVDPRINGVKFTCPLHYCNVCEASKSSNSKRRLVCCTRCPVAYHSGTCIVAGSLPITMQYLVCKRHFMADKKKAHHQHVNVNWCFVCSIGGTLICCDSCPAAFHPECIQETSIPEGRFFCRDCKDGKELLYGEIVWVKLGMYRWWPAQICNPNNIPTNIQKMQHQPGEFPVQFLGSHDYYWIHRGRVFSYQEGDKGSIGARGKYLADIFKKALDEAKEKYKEWQKAQEEKAEKDLEKLSKKPAVYKHIRVNRYTTATRYVIDESELSTCECSINDENPCGPDSHCLNRILYVECSPLKCHAKEKCQNQCFVKRQYLPCEPFRTSKRGWGLKAKADGKKGQFVIEYVGELINEETCRDRVRKGINDGVINYYMLTIDKDCIIDAGPMGNLSRFMNHSCDPNCETQKWTVNGEVRVGLFAKRDIKTGEELVFDYQLDCLGNEKKKCSCGSSNCSGFLGVRPKTQHALKLQEEKKKNQESKKKKKKSGSKKNQVVDEHEDECFDCGDGGELIMCSKSGCSKCYHLSCLTIDKIPHGDWLCPWHFCDDCGKAAMLRCDECSNSFCLAHAPGQIANVANGRYLCDQHPESGLDTSDVRDKIVENSTNTPSDPNETSEDPEAIPENITNVYPNPNSNPRNPTDKPSNASGNSVKPNIAFMNPSSVLTNPGSALMNPTKAPIDPTKTYKVPAAVDKDQDENPFSVPKDSPSVLTEPVGVLSSLISLAKNSADSDVPTTSISMNELPLSNS